LNPLQCAFSSIPPPPPNTARSVIPFWYRARSLNHLARAAAPPSTNFNTYTYAPGCHPQSASRLTPFFPYLCHGISFPHIVPSQSSFAAVFAHIRDPFQHPREPRRTRPKSIPSSFSLSVCVLKSVKLSPPSRFYLSCCLDGSCSFFS